MAHVQPLEPDRRLALRANHSCPRPERCLRRLAAALRAALGPARRHRPAQNTFSHANRTRDLQLAEHLFWQVLAHLQTLAPAFAGRHLPRFAFRFKNRLIHVVDTTTIALMARALPWAKHRRRKAAAKCHVRLNLQTFLPTCVIVGSAAEHDNLRARELCANVRAGEIVIFDKAYVDFAHLADLAQRDVFFVTRAKENLQLRVARKLQDGPCGNILRDDLIVLTGPAAKEYSVSLRRVVALVEVDGEPREMVFLTNNFTWSAQTIADLYRCRWRIETFGQEGILAVPEAC
jgi:Transposase DDE domain